jgi:integrase
MTPGQIRNQIKELNAVVDRLVDTDWNDSVRSQLDEKLAQKDRAQGKLRRARQRLDDRGRVMTGKGIRQRSGNWHFRFQHRGREYSGNTGLPATAANRPQAELFRATRWDKFVKQGADIKPPASVSFRVAAEQFLVWAEAQYREHPSTARRLRTSLASLTAYFGDRHLSTITPADVEGYKAWRRDERGIREHSQRNDLRALSALFEYGVRQHWATNNPVSEVKIPTGKDARARHTLGADEERGYFEKCSELGYRDLRDVGRLVILQGARAEEVLRLEQADIDLHRWVAIIRSDSGRPSRELRLTPEGLAILARRLQWARGRWVFPSPRNTSRHLARGTAQHVRVLLDCRPEERFSLLDLRFTFASRAAARGMPLPQLAAALGVKVRSAVQYFHLPEQERGDGEVGGKTGDLSAGLETRGSPRC